MFAFILTGILSLLLTAPSWAQNYVDSAVLDLSTLKFDGIGVTLTPQWQSHEGPGLGGTNHGNCGTQRK